MDQWEERARKLWQLLDDIDTLDDSCRSDDQAFRSLTREVQRQRFQILTSDGYNLFIPQGQDHDHSSDNPGSSS